MMRSAFRFFISMGSFFAALHLLGGPAHANIPFGWGMFGSSAHFLAGKWSYGISLVAVIIIELVVFHRWCRIPWQEAAMAAFFLNIVSLVAGGIIGITIMIPQFAIVFLLIVIAIFAYVKAPLYFNSVAMCAIVAGIYGAVVNHLAVYMPPQPLIMVFILLFLPLLLGFGLTLIVEAAGAKYLFEDRTMWKALLAANLFSYLFLVSIAPFFFPNPYGEWGAYRKLDQMIANAKEGQEEEILTIIQHLRASNLFLLGLTDDDSPSRTPYEPTQEVRLINKYRQSKPKLVSAIEKDLANMANPDAGRRKVIWSE